MAAPYHITIFKPAAGQNINFLGLANKLGDIANAVIPFLIAIAFVAILWGILKYLSNVGDAEKVAEGKRVVLWGVLALFLMLSFWGFVIMIKTSLFGV